VADDNEDFEDDSGPDGVFNVSFLSRNFLLTCLLVDDDSDSDDDKYTICFDVPYKCYPGTCTPYHHLVSSLSESLCCGGGGRRSNVLCTVPKDLMYH
jgi:hypothetical protein